MFQREGSLITRGPLLGSNRRRCPTSTVLPFEWIHTYHKSLISDFDRVLAWFKQEIYRRQYAIQCQDIGGSYDNDKDDTLVSGIWCRWPLQGGNAHTSEAVNPGIRAAFWYCAPISKFECHMKIHRYFEGIFDLISIRPKLYVACNPISY